MILEGFYSELGRRGEMKSGGREGIQSGGNCKREREGRNSKIKKLGGGGVIL